jgi:hypothetical protein
MKVKLYHGSPQVVKVPTYGRGSRRNDYGLGFYLSPSRALAGEWAVLHTGQDGYINEYELSEGPMAVLKLDAMPITSWIAVLVANRKGTYSDVVNGRMSKFAAIYGVDTKPYDIITGWRADDAFFSYVEDFFSVGLSLEKMSEAMRFGELGTQVCLKSQRAFDGIRFVDSHPAEAALYYNTAIERDRNARKQYWAMPNKTSGTLILDLVGRD